MHETLDVVWWITAVELPALGGLFWLIARVRADADRALESMRVGAETAQAQARESLAAYKLEVAKTYASVATLRDLEKRLTDHLLRIEHKVERRPAVFVDGGAQ